MAKKLDLLNKVFGKLTVIAPAQNKGNKTYWTCRCECNTIKDIQTSHLTGGKTISCGCIKLKSIEQEINKLEEKYGSINITINKNLTNNIIGIYKITNLINEKCYIGQSIDIGRRWKDHLTRYKLINYNNVPIYRSMNKYGIENFKFEILEQCLKEQLDEREIFWINKYESFISQNGYNLTIGGNTTGISSKLTLDDVKEIICLLKESNLSQCEIGEHFNISQRTISYINTGNIWKLEEVSYPIRDKTYNEINYYCLNCGKEITKYSTTGLCLFCYNENQQNVHKPIREVLKQEIRRETFSSLGRKYSVSDNAIRNWCKTYNLPFRKSEIKKFSEEEWALL